MDEDDTEASDSSFTYCGILFERLLCQWSACLHAIRGGDDDDNDDRHHQYELQRLLFPFFSTKHPTGEGKQITAREHPSIGMYMHCN